MKKIIALLVMLTLLGPVIKAEDDIGLLIFNHRIIIGMSYGNVRASWGNPARIDRSVLSAGVREYWFFSNGYMVVFENGKVISFHS